MKKAFLLASIMMVMAVSAQQRPQQGERSGNRKEQRERPTVDQQLKKFDQYNLSSTQKKKVKSLLESRDSDMKKEFANRDKNSTQKGERGSRPEKGTNDFDIKLEKILDKNQFNQYKQDREKRMKSDKFSMHKKRDAKGNRPSSKCA
ncbi:MULTISPECIES: hypothetical protein [Empedobacter]|uniref:DUF4890 domain-containing protein n=1 Tax=Empedobacter falsenii TaxID=343874 RepID=A0A427BET0_9FLAO|nr:MULTISPECIES: hypothetical protein [Empedobacter]MBY0067336.1 hypothetical protein [Empedobacter falsenii]MDH1601141.1 hypothetical protein [Empedobacter sp. GD03739]RRT86320.1 hypothetical protein EGI88_15030 [Empedobacter falsenii]RRT87328.1 hypothetical protein EGI89_15000 [Empedobacter falsenii]